MVSSKVLYSYSDNDEVQKIRPKLIEYFNKMPLISILMVFVCNKNINLTSLLEMSNKDKARFTHVTINYLDIFDLKISLKLEEIISKKGKKWLKHKVIFNIQVNNPLYFGNNKRTISLGTSVNLSEKIGAFKRTLHLKTPFNHTMRNSSKK